MKSVLERIRTRFVNPAARGIDMDAPESNRIFSVVIQKNGFLRRVYQHWYSYIVDALPEAVDGPVLEIGSGAGVLWTYIPGLITSEVQAVPGVNVILDGHFLPFGNHTLRGIVMVDVFHHLSRASLFLAEASRCIKPGGVIAMVEPWCTRWSRFIYRYVHYEPFLPDTKDWHFPPGGPLSAANSALPWVVFKRDAQIFKDRFPLLEIKKITLHTPFAYLLAGGVTVRSLFPESLFDACQKFSHRLEPWMDSLAMFATILIQKKQMVDNKQGHAKPSA